MKKIIYAFLFLSLLTMPIQSVKADCYTGFACSIADIEKQQEEKTEKDIDTFKQYLEQQHKEKDFIIQYNLSSNYDNLFMFNKVLK